MDFSDALRAVKEGKRARRAVWSGEIRFGAYMLLMDMGRPEMMPLLMMYYPVEDYFRPFAGAHWDLLANDWEILDDAELCEELENSGWTA